MAKEKNLVEEAILSMKNLEEAVAENAKGILASTMEQEIKELVKESLKEQDDEIDTEVDMVDTMDTDKSDDDMTMDMDSDDDEMNMDMTMDMDSDEDEMNMDMTMDTDDEDVIDLTDKSDEDVLKVFKLMGPEDSIIVTKDDSNNIHLKDDEKEYMIVQESEEEMEGMHYEEMDEEDDMSDSEIENIIDQVFGETYHNEGETDEMDEESMYEISMDDEKDMDESMVEPDEETEGVVYEITLDDDDDDDDDDEEYLEEGKKSMKPKGKVGSGPKFKFNTKPNMSGGFKEKMKQGPKAVGTGKAKFEFKDGENAGSKLGKNKIVKKVETKEASRTLGSGKFFRKGGLPKQRAHSKFNINADLKESVNVNELNQLREKNEEYRKALNVFREKLNEVAVFNSNLAYATRLFTEHSTSKQEKINILRRFDAVENIKESKNLYKTIKDELSSSTSQTKPVNESVERKIENSVQSGSAANLIESKTYENPQFMRMKDLMSKLTK